MTGPAASVARTLDRVLLRPAPAERTAVLRVALAGWTLWYLAGRVRMFRRIHRTDPRLFAPVGPVRVLRRPVPPPLADALVTAELMAATAVTVGLRHRVTGPVHAVLLLWTLSYRNSWSMIFHNDDLIVLHTAVLGVAPASDAWSVDRLVGRVRGAPPAGADWRHGLAVAVMNATTTATYVLAGVAKVKGPLGWGWASGDSLRSQIAADALRKEVLGDGAARLGLRLHEQTGLFRVLATGSLAVELLAPVALLDRRLGRLWAASAWGMHWGIRATMGIRFRAQQAGLPFLPFLPPELLLAALRRSHARPASSP